MGNDNQKKQVPLRLSPKLYDAIAAWAEDDFRSVNGQIEYLLSECVRQRKRTGNTSRRSWISRWTSSWEIPPQKSEESKRCPL